MTENTIRIHNVETGEIFDREMTPEELAQREADLVAVEAEALESAQKASAKQALLDKLGLSKDEAKLLLG